MWKPEHRRAADRNHLRYPSDLTDAAPPVAVTMPAMTVASPQGAQALAGKPGCVSVFVLFVGERPHPRFAGGRISKHHNTANHRAVGKNVVMLFATSADVLEYKVGHGRERLRYDATSPSLS